MFETKDEYDKFINPEEYERRMALIRLGCENAKISNIHKKKMVELRNRRFRRKQLTDKYDI